MENKLIILFFIFISLSSCTDNTKDIPTSDLTEMDNLFLSGFSMSLEQVYVMSSTNTIPCLDTPADSCFKDTVKSVTINNFVTNLDRINMLTCLSKNEVWNVSKLRTYLDTVYIDRGSEISYYTKKTNITQFNRNNNFIKQSYNTSVYINNVYNLRGEIITLCQLII